MHKNTIETNKLQDKQTSNCRTQRIKLTTNQQRHICYFDLFIVETRFCTHLTSEDICLTQSPSLPKDAITPWMVGIVVFSNIRFKIISPDLAANEKRPKDAIISWIVGIFILTSWWMLPPLYIPLVPWTIRSRINFNIKQSMWLYSVVEFHYIHSISPNFLVRKKRWNVKTVKYFQSVLFAKGYGVMSM